MRVLFIGYLNETVLTTTTVIQLCTLYSVYVYAIKSLAILCQESVTAQYSVSNLIDMKQVG